jgi:hypothetical protein
MWTEAEKETASLAVVSSSGIAWARPVWQLTAVYSTVGADAVELQKMIQPA